MGGGIAQLASYGLADVYLTGSPQLTFWKLIYRRHTLFAMESIQQTFDGTADFGRKATVAIARNGDLVGPVWLEITVPDLLAYDIAVCLNAWCFEPDYMFNVTKARALLGAYAAVRPLSDAERAALPVLCRGAAIRFALTRLFDWINTPPGALVTRKDPMEYMRRLRFFLTAKDEHALGL